MKRIISTLFIAIASLALLQSSACSSPASQDGIPFDKLVQTIATNAHWGTDSLTELGLNDLGSRSYIDEELGECELIVYGSNATATISDDWEVKLEANGKHAYVILVSLASDNGTDLFFKEKADHDAFLEHARQSSLFTHGEYYDSLGRSIIENDEYRDGWYVINFHGD